MKIRDIIQKSICLMMLTLLLISLLMSAYHCLRVKAIGTIYIRADGSVEGTTYIQTTDNVTYFFVQDINDPIVVERDNIIIEGSRYTLNGMGGETGIDLSGRTNVTVQNTQIKSFLIHGIAIGFSSNNIIFENNLTNNGCGVFLGSSSSNTVSRNNLTSNGVGIEMSSSSNNTIYRNNLVYNSAGILFYGSSNNTIAGNNVTANSQGIVFVGSSNNTIYHNNFIENDVQAYNEGSFGNAWNYTYPSGGNYWSDYTGVDANGDGIGDTSYVIDENNTDGYPLMQPWTPVHDVAMVGIVARAFKTVVGQWSTLSFIVTVENQGDFTETFNVTVYYNQTAITIEQWPDGNNTQTFWSMGDVNSDGYIDDWDMYIIAQAWNTRQGDPGWNPDADLNGDGKVNVLDLNTCAKNYDKDIWTTLGIPKLMENQRTVTLPVGNSTITFRWNTTGVDKGNYTISACAWPLPDETDTGDNAYVNGWVVVAMIGDITGPISKPDGKVDMRDVAAVARLFGINYPDPKYDPNCDITGVGSGVPDGKIEMRDVSLVAKAFGKIDP